MGERIQPLRTPVRTLSPFLKKQRSQWSLISRLLLMIPMATPVPIAAVFERD